MPSIVVTAHDAAYKEMADITYPSVRHYADKHDYALLYRPDIDEREKDACKARLFLELYHTGMFSADDCFLWLDTDALVMNSKWKFHKPRNHFTWAYNWDGPNSGVWIARFTSHAAHFVSVYDQTCRGMGWGDNYGMVQTMLLPPFRDWVDCVPGRAMNAAPYELYGLQDMAHKNEINNYNEGDPILHLPGLPHERRMSVLREYAALAK